LTVAEGADASPAPRELVPLTVHVYVRPEVSAVTTSGLAAPAFVRVMPPLDDTHVAVNDDTAAPLLALAVNVTRS
jgi:hypothetical protein